jgi:hypothetical protein
MTMSAKEKCTVETILALFGQSTDKEECRSILAVFLRRLGAKTPQDYLQVLAGFVEKQDTRILDRIS